MTRLPKLYISDYSVILIVILFSVNSFGTVFGQIPVNQKEQLNNKATEIFISEVTFPSTFEKARYLELYNPTSSDINLADSSYYLSCDDNGNNNIKDVPLTGEIKAYSTFICARYTTDFYDAFGFNPDQVNNSWSLNGNDIFILCKGGGYSSGLTIDIYGVVGGSAEQLWEYNDAHAVRKRDVIDPNPVWDSTEWVILPADYDLLTPGQHNNDISFSKSSGSWNTRGNWTGSALGFIPDASTNVVIEPTQRVSINATTVCNQLTISENAEVSISAGKYFFVLDSIINLEGPQGLILNSDASSNSSLIHYSDSAQATVHSYFADLTSWYLIASPMLDDTAGVFLDQYLDYWDEPNAQWMDILGEETPLVPGQGYSLQKGLNNTATYTGRLNNGNVTISELTRTVAGSYFDAGWNLVGNPYPSVLDISKLDFGSNIGAAASVWVHGSNTYINWSQGGGGNIEARYIQPGQGFMIQLAANDQSLTFTNTARTHNGLASYDKNISEELRPNSLKISLTDQEERTDNTYLCFNNEATIGYDTYFDVHKLFGAANYPHIYSFIDIDNDEKASIQGMPFPENGDSIHLGYQIGQPGNYYIQITGISQFEANQNIYLIDHYKQESYNIRQDSVFAVYLDSDGSQNRFDLLYGLSNSTNVENNQDCNIYLSHDQLIIDQSIAKDGYNELVIYNLMGQQLRTYTLNTDHQVIPLDLPTSYYTLQVRGKNKILNKKILIN